MSQVPWSRIRVSPRPTSSRHAFDSPPIPPANPSQEFKEQEERKRRRELEQAMGLSPGGVGGLANGGTPSAALGGDLSQQQQQQEAAAQGIVERFDQAYLKDRLLFGAIVSVDGGATTFIRVR